MIFKKTVIIGYSDDIKTYKKYNKYVALLHLFLARDYENLMWLLDNFNAEEIRFIYKKRSNNDN